MARITKDQAERIAKELTAKQREVIDAESRAINNEVIKTHYYAAIPAEVRALYDKFPEFTNRASCIRLTDGGRIISYAYPTKNTGFENGVPCSSLPNGSSLNDQKLAKREIHNTSKQNELDHLVTEISQAIYNIRTDKALAENFPEASALLLSLLKLNRF